MMRMSFIACYQIPLRIASCRLPLYDFLAPRLALPIIRRTTNLISLRRASSTATAPPNHESASDTLGPSLRGSSTIAQDSPAAGGNPQPLSKPLTKAQRDFLTSALRVNQAGELAATLIYTAQIPVLVNSHPHLRPLLKHMHDQEAGHLKTFNTLLARHRVRPTAMYPIWTIAASALGWGTALMGREAVMACTEAVETEIGDHYNGQVRALLGMIRQMEADGQGVGEELRELVSTIRRIRDEELEHLDHAVENDAKEAVPHAFLTGVIRAGCRGAIWVSERI